METPKKIEPNTEIRFVKNGNREIQCPHRAQARKSSLTDQDSA